MLCVTPAALPAPPCTCSPQRWLTSIFLHQNAVHLITNSLMLAGFGGQLECKHGTWRVVLLAVLSGLAGNLLRCGGSGNVLCGCKALTFTCGHDMHACAALAA